MHIGLTQGVLGSYKERVMMRDALTQLLYSRYPVLFAEHGLDVTKSGMAWGFQHDDGWFAIVDALASVLIAHAPGATAADVKHKMGALRFSLHEGDAFTSGACAAAERFSMTVSEMSGRHGILMVGRQGRWLKTLALGELAGFVPVRSQAPGACCCSLEDDTVHAGLDSNPSGPQADGAHAFHQAMLKRLHPMTGASGPVNDQGLMANDTEGT